MGPSESPHQRALPLTHDRRDHSGNRHLQLFLFLENDGGVPQTPAPGFPKTSAAHTSQARAGSAPKKDRGASERKCPSSWGTESPACLGGERTDAVQRAPSVAQHLPLAGSTAPVRPSSISSGASRRCQQTVSCFFLQGTGRTRLGGQGQARDANWNSRGSEERERHSTWCQARCVSLWEPESPTWALTSLLGQLVRAHFMSVQLHKAASLLSKAVECLRKSKLDNTESNTLFRGSRRNSSEWPQAIHLLAADGHEQRW